MTGMPESEAPESTALYRIRGEGDVLIYIGITNSVPFRWNGHQSLQPWWDEVRSVTVEWYDTRAEAAAAEKAAILAEQPKYNVTYLKPSRGQRNRQRPEAAHVDWENFALESRDDDEGLLNEEDLARLTRMTVGVVKSALNRTGGPRGFKLGAQLLYRKGEIRRWIAANEASQRMDGKPLAHGDVTGSAA